MAEAVGDLLFLFVAGVFDVLDTVAPLQSLPGLLEEIRHLGVAVGDVVGGEVQFVAKVQVHVAAVGDVQGGGQGLGVLAEQLGHLGGVLHVELRRAVLHPVRVAHDRLGLQTDHAIVGFPVVGIQVVHIVGGHQRQAGAPGHLEQAFGREALFRQAVVLQFNVETVRPQDLGVFPRAGGGAVDVAADAQFRHLALETGGQTDEPLAVLGEGGPGRCAACSRSPRGRPSRPG